MHDPTGSAGTRFAPLRAWLERHYAKLLCDGQLGQSYARMYAVNGRLTIVLHAPDESGWDLFVQASSTNDINATLYSAEQALGLTPTKEKE